MRDVAVFVQCWGLGLLVFGLCINGWDLVILLGVAGCGVVGP